MIKPPMIKIMFFGDSICYGWLVASHRTWVTLISKHLYERYGKRLWVNNCSIPGNTTRMALERMPFDVQAYGVDIILIQFGINDCNLWETDGGLPRVSKEAFQTNLEEIINRAKVFGARHVLLNTNHPTSKFIQLGNKQIAHQKGNKKYNGVIRKVAQVRDDVRLIDIEKRLFTMSESFVLPDGIHLSEVGHDLYFSIVCPYLEQAVEDVIGEGNEE